MLAYLPEHYRQLPRHWSPSGANSIIISMCLSHFFIHSSSFFHLWVRMASDLDLALFKRLYWFVFILLLTKAYFNTKQRGLKTMLCEPTFSFKCIKWQKNLVMWGGTVVLFLRKLLLRTSSYYLLKPYRSTLYYT